jgi:uncharacterized protein
LKLVNQYIIPYKGLIEGEHRFNFEFGAEFFEEYTSLEIKSGLVRADVLLNKKGSFLELSVVLTGNINIQCDRCLEYFLFPLEFQGNLFVKFKETPEEPDDEVIFIHPNEDVLDLTQYFIDNIGLSIPIQKFHSDLEDGTSGCDPEMLTILDEYTNKNLNEENMLIDLRWSKLNDLLNKEGNKN